MRQKVIVVVVLGALLLALTVGLALANPKEEASKPPAKPAVATAGADQLRVTEETDVTEVLAGDSVVRAPAGDDVVSGDAGKDALREGEATTLSARPTGRRTSYPAELVRTIPRSKMAVVHQDCEKTIVVRK